MEGGVWALARWAMAMKEVTRDEHWVLYGRDKLLNSTPETNTALHVS